MKILLIQPTISKSSGYKKKIFGKLNLYPALGLEQLASNTPSKHEVKIVHENSSNIKFSSKWDLVGITCTTPLAPRAYEIADEFRKLGVTVIIGGAHPSALPEEAKQHVDSVVIGEAELSWQKLLTDFENGNIKPIYTIDKPVDLNLIKNPNRKKSPHFSFIAAAQASRGCPMGCEFCGVTNSKYGRVFRTRPIEKVIEDLREIKQKRIWFYDPSLTINPTFSKQLFRAMKGLNKKFYAFGNMSVLYNDEEFLRLARDAGCHSWFIGFESVSQDTIDKLGKKSNKVEEYAECIKKIHDYGMTVIGAFIFGFDSDTPDVFEKTREMVENLSIDYIQVNNLVPYPGTPLFERLQKEGRIITYDWTKYTESGNVVFQPKHMSSEELLEKTNQFRRDVLSLKSTMRRVIKNKDFIIRNLSVKLLNIV